MKIFGLDIRRAQALTPAKKEARNSVPKARGSRSFSAARIDRLTEGWTSQSLTTDADLRLQLPILRARSRDLWMNNDYAKKFFRLVRVNVVGHTGIRMQNKAKDPNGNLDSRANDMIEAAWRHWGKKGQCDVTGRLSWLDVQKTFIETMARDGEVILRKVKGFDNAHRFAVQFLEPDLLDHTLNTTLANGNEIRLGIEFDQWDRPVRYYFLRRHPGDYGYVSGAGQKHLTVPAAEILHRFLPERIRQSRGIPWLHTAAARLNMLAGYEDAELVAARVTASKMGFFTKKSEDGFSLADGEDDNGNPVTDAEPGTFEELPQGYDFKAWDPQHPTQAFPFFLKAMLRGAASGMGVAYHALANDLEGVNFSSIRSGTLEERDMWRELQTMVVENLCGPIFEDWLNMALLSGAVPLPHSKFDKFNAPAWKPRGWDWVDPKKDQEACALAVENKFKTWADVLAEQGKDLEEHLEQLALEQKIAESKGVALTIGGNNATTTDEDGDALSDADA